MTPAQQQQQRVVHEKNGPSHGYSQQGGERGVGGMEGCPHDALANRGRIDPDAPPRTRRDQDVNEQGRRTTNY